MGHNIINNLRNITWTYIIFYCILLSCDKNNSDIEENTHLKVSTKEVLIDFVDIDNCHLAKTDSSQFKIISENGSTINTYLLEKDGNAYLTFKPTLHLKPEDCNKEEIKQHAKINCGDKEIAVVESIFKLDSVRSINKCSILYYTNIENRISCRTIESPVKMLIGKAGSYREEESAKISVLFHFPSTKISTTEQVDYNVTISGFMGQSIKPSQKGLFVTANSSNSTNVALTIDGIIHNYYDVYGTLQEPYDIVYKISSKQLFGDKETHVLRITNSGDCNHNKIIACNFDGKQLNLSSIVDHTSFGEEYIHLIIE